MMNWCMIKKVNVPVCVISISSLAKKGGWYFPQFRLQECSYENDYI